MKAETKCHKCGGTAKYEIIEEEFNNLEEVYTCRECGTQVSYDESELLEIASSYISYTDSKDIADLIYDNYQAEIYANLNIKTKNDFVAILGDNKQFKLKELENACNFTVDLVVKFLGKLSQDKLISFAREHYDENFRMA